VRAALGDLADARLQVFGGVVDDVGRAALTAELELLPARCRRDDARAELAGDVDGGQAHSPGRAEDDHPVARLHFGYRAKGVIRGPVRHVERGRLAEVGAVRHLRDLPGREDGALRERAVEGRAEDEIPCLEAAHLGADREHLAGQLAARHERRLHGYLIGIGDHQRVGEVGGRGAHLNKDVGGAGDRVR
jgi:hypothetical protein